MSFINSAISQSLDAIAKKKIIELKNIVKNLEKKNIETSKEELAITTAEIFLEFADWDEKNKEENARIYKTEHFYIKDAEKMAENLAEFERKEVILLLDETIASATKLVNDDYQRIPYVRPDWSKLQIVDNRILNGDKPVFLSDYTWRPRTKKLNTYFGDLNNFYIDPIQLKNRIGKLNADVKDKILNNRSDNAGFVFIGHNAPEWAANAYGESFNKIKGKPFTRYDIDNPGAREMLSTFFKSIVPHLAGTKYTQLGYMLSNEPRWANYTNEKESVYFRADVSNYTIEKFKKWLEKKHGTIKTLNALWNASFKDFNDIDAALPVDLSERGTAKWFDWTTFNHERVTEWFVFMKAEIRKYDPNAKVHLKIMPSIFTNNDPDSGIDFEILTELSEINGNDIASHYNTTKKVAEDWQENYAWGWRELYMGYDFLKSVQPKQINFNSESHLLSASHVRDLYMNPKYARATYWAAHTLGLNATQTWYWPRRVDGSLKAKTGRGYAGSNNQQPRVTFELENTLLDLNRFSEDITAIQNERKPIRIFYSKTSATQKSTYMDDLFELYEDLNFEGLSLGFATQSIIKRIDNSEWDVILIHKTEQVTSEELLSLQQYLDDGGTIILDKLSLKTDEYNRPTFSLKESKGQLITISSLSEMKIKALSIIENKNMLPPIKVIENNGNTSKKCIWRVAKNNKERLVLSIVNVGKEKVELTIKDKKTNLILNFKDKITNSPINNKFKMKPYEVLFIEELKK
ncbi:beta-galactosidase [uncultured Aquimarina sp.]|uniref:beta-galactosidase n=1 Tax=uncultured Aquimarina sp. TaxID=575652 RepID=UPI00260F76D7|nr:beta-galactosidase [uncultured Aquimarina sp.]